jgi:Glyoxalase-like domain
VITGVDHVILALAREEHARFSERLRRAGFVYADAGRHVGQGTANENLALAGGSYLELLFPDPPPEPPRAWYETAPHVLGVCFTSTDVDADAATWAGAHGSWTQRLEKTLDDGTDVVFRLAGPHDRDAPFFVFLLERKAPAFAELDAPARREDMGRWLRLDISDGAAFVGGVDFRFDDDGRPGLSVDAEFGVPDGEGDLPLRSGRIVLRRV